MSKTLLLTPDFPPRRGGVARYLAAVAFALADRVVVYASPEAHAVDTNLPYRVVRAPLSYPIPLFGWLRSVRILIREAINYDRVIVSHVLPFGTATLITQIFTKKPYVVFVHGMDISLAQRSAWKSWLAKIVLQRADLVIANSVALKDELRAEFAVQRAAFVHPAAGFDGVEVSPLTHDSLRLITVARLVPRKGHLRVLEALSRLRERGELAHLSYMIVGDGPMADEIERRAMELGLNDVVEMKHHVSDADLPALYRSSDIFVMPTAQTKSDREGFGIVYLEAALFGLPSVATEQRGVDEAVLDGHTGLLVPDGDIEALARAIVKLSTDKDLRHTLGTNGQTRAREEFSEERQTEKIRRLLM